MKGTTTNTQKVVFVMLFLFSQNNILAQYQIPAIVIKIYNMLGEHVKTIVEGIYNTGNYEVVFDARELSSGTYIYRIESEKFVMAKKLILLK